MNRKILIPSVIIAAILVAGVMAAVLFGSATAEVTVSEALSSLPLTFTIAMYPGETNISTITVNNVASVPLNVEIIWEQDQNLNGVNYTTNMPLIQGVVPGVNFITLSWTIMDDSEIGNFNGSIWLSRV